MKPGRELDALIAEKVMGCKVLWQASSVYGPYCGCLSGSRFQEGPHSGPNRFDENLKDYSTDISAAWEVAKKLANMLGVHGEFQIRYVSFNGEWHVDTESSGLIVHVAAETAPHAICLAALKAVGYEFKNDV